MGDPRLSTWRKWRWRDNPYSEVARLGIQYIGQGWNSCIRFLRANGGLDGALAVDTDGKERVRVDSSGRPLSLFSDTGFGKVHGERRNSGDIK